MSLFARFLTQIGSVSDIHGIMERITNRTIEQFVLASKSSARSRSYVFGSQPAYHSPCFHVRWNSLEGEHVGSCSEGKVCPSGSIGSWARFMNSVRSASRKRERGGAQLAQFIIIPGTIITIRHTLQLRGQIILMSRWTAGFVINLSVGYSTATTTAHVSSMTARHSR